MYAKRIIIGLGVVAAALAGCSGLATPRLIGSYPRYATPTPLVVALGRAYHTTLDVQVADVDAAARQAEQLAYQDGGYLVASQSWYQDGQFVTSLTLAVPASQFDALRGAVVALGRLVDERLVSEPAPWPADPPVESTVTVIFAPAAPAMALPGAPSPAWSPAGAFAQASAVFVFILTILIDVIIWVGVVVGPFALIGLALRWLLRRRRQP